MSTYLGIAYNYLASWYVTPETETEGGIELSDLTESTKTHNHALESLREKGKMTIADNTMMQSNNQFSTKEAVFKQLGDVRYQTITVNKERWAGPEALFNELLKEGFDENKGIHILNQLEIQTFTSPFIALSTAVMEHNLMPVHNYAQSLNINLDIQPGEPLHITGKQSMNLLFQEEIVGTAELAYAIHVPRGDGAEQGTYSYEIL